VPQPKRPKASKKPNGMTLKKVAGRAAMYVEHRSQRDAADAEMKKIAPELKEFAEVLGAENDKGSFILKLANGLTVSKIAVNKDRVDEQAAIEVLKKNHVLDRCTKVSIDIKEVERCLEEGLIGVDDINKFTQTITSYRLDVRAKK